MLAFSCNFFSKDYPCFSFFDKIINYIELWLIEQIDLTSFKECTKSVLSFNIGFG